MLSGRSGAGVLQITRGNTVCMDIAGHPGHHDKEKPHCGCIAGICSGVFLILRPCLFVCWECLFWLLSLSLSFFFSSLLFCLSACSVFGEVSANTIHIVEMGFLPMGYVTVGDLQHKAVV